MKVEVAVLGSPSLKIRTVSVDVKQLVISASRTSVGTVSNERQHWERDGVERVLWALNFEAKDITQLIAWRREALKEEALDDLP